MRQARIALAVAVALASACASCSGDPPIRTTAAAADGLTSPLDVPLADLGGDAAGDSGVPDAVPDAADDAQVPTDVAIPQDVTAADAGPTDVLPPWLAGTWQDCSGTLVLTPQGTWTWQDGEQTCGVTGTAQMTAGSLDLTADATTCALPVWVHTGLGVARHGALLTFLHPAFQAPRTFATGPVDRQRWLVQDDQADVANLDLCFTAAGEFYTGRWKSTQGCGFLACGGVVDGLQVVGSAWQLWTHCSGSCACSGLIVAPIHTADSLSGTFSSATCMNANTGSFTATRVPFPQP